MRGTRRGLGWAVMTLAVIGVVAVTGVAVGGKRLKTSSETTSIAPGENGSATARCKEGTKAVSGGFETQLTNAGASFIPFQVTQSNRSAGREWTAVAHNQSGEPGDLTSFAYCRDERVETVSEAATLSPVDFETLSPRCPQGTKVISGGFAAEPITPNPTPVLTISESRKVGKRTWEVSAFANGNEEGDLAAYAHCREGKKLKTKQSSAPLSSDADESAVIEARCKRKQRVVSGGFGSPDDSGGDTPVVFTSKKAGRRSWGVGAFVGITGNPTEVTAYAYCEKKKPKNS